MLAEATDLPSHV